MSRRRALLLCVLLVAAIAALGAGLAYGERSREKPEDHDSGWQWLHGREAVRDYERCTECHQGPEACATCHLAEWPHPEGFLKRHGAEALKLDGRGCSLCHRPAFCDPCHGGVSMPHPDDYLTRHPVDQARAAACQTCHVQADCDACHTAHAAHRSQGAIE